MDKVSPTVIETTRPLSASLARTVWGDVTVAVRSVLSRLGVPAEAWEGQLADVVVTVVDVMSGRPSSRRSRRRADVLDAEQRLGRLRAVRSAP